MTIRKETELNETQDNRTDLERNKEVRSAL